MLDSVIVVDDETSIRTAVEQWLSLSGFDVQLYSCAEDCLHHLPAQFAGVIVSDVRMPGMGGLALLKRLQQLDADLPVILLTGHGDVPMAVEAMREGAYDFLEKPFSPEALLSSLRRALEKRRLVLENRRLHEQVDVREQLDRRLLGVSRSLQTLRRQVMELAPLPVMSYSTILPLPSVMASLKVSMIWLLTATPVLLSSGLADTSVGSGSVTVMLKAFS